MLPSPSPSDARTILTLAVIPALRLEHTLTCRVLAGLPDDRASFRPQDGARTAGELAGHIVRTEVRWLDGIATGGFREITDPSGAPDGGTALVDYYRARFASAVDALAMLPAEHLVRKLDYRGVVRMPALGFATLAMHHTIHHRGQLSVYLRSMGLPVPAIYG